MNLVIVLFLIFVSACSSALENPINQKMLEHSSVDAKVKNNTNASEKIVSFKSLNGKQELCTILEKIPKGDYSKSDVEDEEKYCAISFTAQKIALCPKTWSTSPATMIYDLTESSFTAESYESSSHCGVKKKAEGVSTIVKFKQTMNASGTSGTFSQSSLLYYHFSRYFDSKVRVPVAVYRDMDKDIHRERVTRKGVKKALGSMIKAGWQHLLKAEENPKAYRPTTDLFTDDQTNIYGVLVDGSGERYGTELNGTRASGWGKGQNRDFQKTPAFLALRDSSNLLTAIDRGLDLAAKDTKMRSDLVGIEDLQMVYWMRELIEITLLDFIFSQQDRIGNIDYQWYWYYVQDGRVKSSKEKRKEYKDLPRKSMGKIRVPEALSAFNPALIQRTNINDNDAGGKSTYVNFTQTTNMLDGLKHYSAKIFNQLMILDKDFSEKGDVYNWLIHSIDLDDKSISRIIANTHKAAEILREQCSEMTFDLDDVDNFLVNGVRAKTLDCSAF